LSLPPQALHLKANLLDALRNLAALEKRIESLKARLESLRPKAQAQPQVITFTSEVNRNAPREPAPAPTVTSGRICS